MKTYVTSDLHFGHANIITYAGRPYDTVEEMNQALIDNWNDVVTDQDTVWVLGDICLGKREETLKFVTQLKGDKWLIPGNHDHVHPMYSGKKHFAESVRMYKDAGLRIIHTTQLVSGTLLLAEFAGETSSPADYPTYIRMCHFPYNGDSNEEHDRYKELRPIDDGMPLLHGHMHSKIAYRGHQCDVGVDAWDMRPQLLETILKGFNS